LSPEEAITAINQSRPNNRLQSGLSAVVNDSSVLK
jgi:hypothetical protein